MSGDLRTLGSLVTLVWRCLCRGVNYLHWETCVSCGSPQPPPPEPKKPTETMKSIEKAANKGLALRYDICIDGWLIERGDGSRVGWTRIGPGQIISDFKGETFTDKVVQMMSAPENWHETTPW